MPGPVPKDADRRQRRNKRGAGLVLADDADGRIVPEPPEGLLEVWAAAWCNTGGALLDPALAEERAQALRSRAKIMRGYAP